MSVRHAPVPCDNPFLTRPVWRLVLSNALPMAIVLSMGGLLSVVDGVFVGRFVGVDGLAAVSAAFPVVMLLTALTALIGGGMSSLLARQLGRGARATAAATFASAHGLAVALCIGLLGAALAFGPAVVGALSAGDPVVARLAAGYLLILILGAPVQFALGVQSDALRNEGRAGQIALLSVLVNLVNLAANYGAIVLLDLGVVGSAIGTVTAQGLGLALAVALRASDPELLPLAALHRHPWHGGWGRILALGLPLSLSFAGMALVAGTVLLALRAVPGAGPQVAAYGVVTRLLGLAFLPLMAMALTTQSITGHNAGAGRMDRARAALRLAVGGAFLWGLAVSLLGLCAGRWLGALFSDDAAVIAATATILRPMTALYAFSGPILVLAMHYQALGAPLRTAVLTLVKPWLLTPGLVLCGAAVVGPEGLWLAFPVADASLLLLTLAMLIGWPSVAPVPAGVPTMEEGA